MRKKIMVRGISIGGAAPLGGVGLRQPTQNDAAPLPFYPSARRTCAGADRAPGAEARLYEKVTRGCSDSSSVLVLQGSGVGISSGGGRHAGSEGEKDEIECDASGQTAGAPSRGAAV